MKRRVFLTASSTIGIAGVVSGTSVLSSVYSSMSTSVLLQDFSAPTRKMYDKFMTNAITNTEALGLDPAITKRIVTPVQIISADTNTDKQKIVYKNKSGEYITLSVIEGVERIEVSKML